MSTGDLGDAVPARELADDAVRLLRTAQAPDAPDHTRHAAIRLRDCLHRQLDDGAYGDGELDRFNRDPSIDEAARAVVDTIAACLRDDPDFAAQTLRIVNSDCVVDGIDADPAALRALGAPASRIRWGWVAGVAVLVLVVGSVVRFWPPERSVDSYCDTFRTEGTKLHQRWAEQGRQAKRDDDVLLAISSVAAAPRDLASFFTTLERTAPEDIRADVLALRDAWRIIADQVGDGGDPLTTAAAGLMVGLSVSNSERRVDRWTSANCPQRAG